METFIIDLLQQGILRHFFGGLLLVIIFAHPRKPFIVTVLVILLGGIIEAVQHTIPDWGCSSMLDFRATLYGAAVGCALLVWRLGREGR
tara:strand:+ start:6526 stop:6792 length:267 start_codon:yes stop_codon:yes gene_type:complete